MTADRLAETYAYPHGNVAAGVLDGLVLGLAAPAVFFLVLALVLPGAGLVAFAVAAAAALLTQGGALFGIPRGT
jgi:hypothetical protein